MAILSCGSKPIKNSVARRDNGSLNRQHGALHILGLLTFLLLCGAALLVVGETVKIIELEKTLSAHEKRLHDIELELKFIKLKP